MPRWALGTVILAPLGALLGQGGIESAVEVARGGFVLSVFLMSTWLVLGLHRSRLAL
jgi:uncharacterized membrane protein YtjA (UPF0391 family)